MNQILCLSSSPWRSIPTRTQQLMTRLKDAKLLYFEPPGKHWKKPGREMRPGLTVYTLPPVLEAEERHQLLFRRHYRKLASHIQRQMDRHRFREPLIWCTSPEQVHLLEYLPHKGIVYDCDRDWPDYPPEWESDLALASDVIFAASPGLVDHLSPCNDNIALLPNGVNHQMFTRPEGECPPELARIPGPVLGYCGVVWEDLELGPVAEAAQVLPDCTFVFLGRVEDSPMARRLERFPNVLFLGRRAPVEVPDYLARFDVCLNLRRRSERYDDIVPTRIYEYLSSGKPIVSMFYPEQVEHFPDVIYGAHSPEEFTRLCRRALTETGDWARLRRQEHGAGAAWSVRAEQVQRILTAIGLYH